ncbi:MAG TPA: TIGR00730 family Rossman fold protein [Terriglobales bacterium]|nr:TIGR00730 family Rossman fold protein [Terriglobales bacterium]
MTDDTPFRSPLAYENKKFLNSPDGRVLRVLSEYLEPLARFRRERIQDTVVFFGSARFHSQSDAADALQLLEKPFSKTPAPPGEQENFRLAQVAVEMAHYYEEARQLAYMLTTWALSLPSKRQRFVVTTGGGPGIMEAANRGAREAGGKTIGLNINLPYEQMPNRYITPELNFEFHYFFMRKLWFAYLSKALIVFPGGFGTFDELFEILTLAQTEKLAKKIAVVMYGREYWNKIINFQALVDSGVIAREDLDLFKMVDTPEEGFEYLKENLTRHHLGPTPREKEPEIAKTRP